MLRYFRNLRKNLLMSDKTRKYILYALGEIALVMIGILLALQVTNWNEERNREAYEIKMLQEVLVALEQDSTLIVTFIEERMDRREQAIDTLMKAKNTGIQLNRGDLTRLYDDLTTEFLYRFNAGPYEAIKSNGLDLISNDQLRAEISDVYETTLPAFKAFIEVVVDGYEATIQELEPEYLTNEIVWHNNEWHNHYVPADDDMLTNPAFNRVLGFEVEKARNSRSRINTIKAINADLRNKIQQELKNRGY